MQSLNNTLQETLHRSRIAILGVTGQIGRRLLGILASYDVPKDNLTLTSQNLAKVSYKEGVVETKFIDNIDFSKQDLVFNCTPATIIQKYIGEIWANDCIIIDKSSAFRDSAEIPLVVPEVNGHLVEKSRLISSPNCIVVPVVMVLHAIWSKLSNVGHISLSTYQSVSGAGNTAMDALLDETKRVFFEQKIMPKFFERQIAFNVIPKIGEYNTENVTDEESKVELECNKILCPVFGIEKLPMSVTCTRVPTLIGHGICMHIACDIIGGLPAIEAELLKYPGVQYSGARNYVSITDCAYEQWVYVSRLRRSGPGLALWVACDNLEKGGAQNGFQIAAIKLQQKVEPE